MTSRKRKSEESGPSHGKRVTKEDEVCVIHFSKSNCEFFTNFTDCKGKESRFEKLQDIGRQRLSQPEDSPYRMEDSCKLLPEELKPEHGYHRDCYQRFTGNLKRLKISEPVQDQPRKSGRTSEATDNVIFNPDCIFCNKEGRKKVKIQGIWTTERTTVFEKEGWKTVIDVAEQKQDEKLLKRIRGFDLFACEAHYHPKCQKQYLRNPQHWQSEDQEAKNEQDELQESHNMAFTKVCEVIDKEIIQGEHIMKLSHLLKVYIAALQQTEHANPNYRAEKLKKKLEKEQKYVQNLHFCLNKKMGKFNSYIVYSSTMKKDQLVTLAYELGSADMIQDVALYLKDMITEAFQQADDLPWPPSDDFLHQSDVLPNDLERFLNFLLAGKAENHSAKVQRMVSSLGQDICRAVTRGQWKLPKHVLICMTLRHLFRSEELATLLNRLGHSESYRFSLELETAIAKSLEESSSYLSTQIVTDPTAPSLFHSEFDNFDQLMNVLEGKGSVHTAHGIMLQEVSGESDGTKHTLATVTRTKEQRLEICHQELPECYVTARKSPCLHFQQKTIPGGQEAQQKATRINLLWILLRLHSSLVEQDVPGWAGFVSMTGERPEKKTTIDYYPVIFNPITEYKTVQECLRQAECATHEVGQEYVITTFDLGVCMKAYPLIWNQPQRFEKHIILIGTFHLVCAYLKMIGKKMDGSGLSDVLLEAELITSGSLKGVESGKQYDRALHCHKTMLECLERLMLASYLKMTEDRDFPQLTEETMTLLAAAKGASTHDSVAQLLDDKGMSDFFRDYEQFKEDVRLGKHGKTPQFWMSYMDHIWLVLSLLYAVKVNDFELYAQCLLAMPDLFFSFGGQNYARYLTFFGLFIANIELSHPGSTELLKRGAFSVARSFIPGNRCAVDKTMEETFMRNAKSKGGASAAGAGLTGIASNYPAYQKWVRTTHQRTKYMQVTMDMAGMARGSELDTQHRDLRPTEVTRSEKSVARALAAVESFTNPFEVHDKEKLIMLSSGATVPGEIEKDVLRAEAAGRSEKEKFITERLETREHFFEPVKRLKLKVMADTSKRITLKSTQNKVTEYKHQGNVAFQLLVKSQEGDLNMDLKQLMTYQLTPVPYSLGTADGYLAKTDKSAAFHYLTKTVEDAEFPPVGETLLIIDGNATFHAMQQVPPNFRQICQKLYDMVPPETDFVFSTDMYQGCSVKSMERKRRGSGDKIILKGDSTKRPADWKAFLANEENKVQFIRLLLDVWSKDSFAEKHKGRNIVLVCEGKAFKLTSADGRKTDRQELHSLSSTQEETDSRVILYSKYGQDQGYKYIRVKSPDTDVFFILLNFAIQLDGVTILFDSGKGNKKRLIDISDLAKGLTQPFCTALLSLHAYTGCDSTSAFKGRGKVKAVKVLQQKPAFVQTLAQLGDTWDVQEQMTDDLESFTCCVYGRSRFSKVDELRHHLLKEKCGEEIVSASQNVDLATLPPSRRSLKQHVRRCNYQVAIWKRGDQPVPDIPNPTEGHGWVVNNGILEPLWIEEEEELTLPQTVIDNLLNDVLDSDEEEEDDRQCLLQNGLDDSLDSSSEDSDQD